MKDEKKSLESESQRATDMLKGKVVQTVWRHRSGEVGIQFTDGTRFFIDTKEGSIELSITGGS
jgi:hypothetical protein